MIEPEEPSAPAPPRVVAVVVTYNRLTLLQRLLERLDTVPGLAEVVVVDNASSDGTGEWLAASTTARHRRAPHRAGLRAPWTATAAGPAGSTSACSRRSTAAPTWSG